MNGQVINAVQSMAVPHLRTGDGIGRDTRGIVIRRASDQPRSEERKESPNEISACLKQLFSSWRHPFRLVCSARQGSDSSNKARVPQWTSLMITNLQSLREVGSVLVCSCSGGGMMRSKF